MLRLGPVVAGNVDVYHVLTNCAVCGQEVYIMISNYTNVSTLLLRSTIVSSFSTCDGCWVVA